jgi:mannose-1-phosphate guanylyltransferase
MRNVTAVLLAAGYGTRLRPYSNSWPKCLMPINGVPLMDYWLGVLVSIKVNKVLVNLHYLADIVRCFLERPVYKDWVSYSYEAALEGTAGTLRKNREYLVGSTILLAHADNFCHCDFNEFLSFHLTVRPRNCVITMMTFTTQEPSTCGIVEVDAAGVVIGFHEKVAEPPGNLANGAVYLLDPCVLDWICDNLELKDFSTQVLPHFVGRIATWHNSAVHIDIGSIEALEYANKFFKHEKSFLLGSGDAWSREFTKHPIHQLF